jgi:hypothetical protein
MSRLATPVQRRSRCAARFCQFRRFLPDRSGFVNYKMLISQSILHAEMHLECDERRDQNPSTNSTTSRVCCA